MPFTSWFIANQDKVFSFLDHFRGLDFVLGSGVYSSTVATPWDTVAGAAPRAMKAKNASG
jgi:hypothetical protein